MTSNSQTIIQAIRQEFEMMLDFVTGEQAHKATADQIERGLFKLLLAVGAKLLMLFFVMRSEACSRETIQTAAGATLPYERDTKRTYYSIFGKLPLYRPYFYQQGVAGQTPLDEALGLGEDSYSDLVREVSDYLGVYNVYHKTGEILCRLLGLNLSTGAIESNIADDAAAVESYYAQKPPPQPAEEAEILVIQADGKGVPMVLEELPEPQVRLGKGQKRGRKKEAMVTSVYTIAANPRTPQAVVNSFFRHNPTDTARNRGRPQHKHIWATLDGKDAALARLAQQVATREGDHILARVALCDGYEPLQTRVTKQFPDFTLILDFIHADEYLWDVANMAYDTYLKRGWPIASGVIEGACRHFVKDRCESSGMRWTPSGVENLLRLRAVAENGDWDDYHQFRKRQRHTRLYGQPYPEQLPLEMQAIDNSSLFEKRPGTSTHPVVEPITAPDTQALYHQLPLAV